MLLLENSVKKVNFTSQTGKPMELLVGDFECPVCKGIFQKNLSNGRKAKTCSKGCFSKLNGTHTLQRTIMKGIHNGVIRRCDDLSNPHYGGKGIRYSKEWVNFETFYQDMKTTWVVGHELDRRDSSLGYNKENCQWISQATNRAKEHTKQVIQFNLEGEEVNTYISVAIAANATGLDRQGIARCARGERIKHGGYLWAYTGICATSKYDVRVDTHAIVAKPAIRQPSTAEHHGKVDTPLYKAWANLKHRNGLVCDPSWVASFIAFYGDMNSTYFEGAYLVRRNKQLPFTKDNCFWESKAEATGRNRQRAIEQLDKITGAVLKEWTSIKEAAIALSIDPSSMTKVCKGKKKTAGNFIWKYKEVA